MSAKEPFSGKKRSRKELLRILRNIRNGGINDFLVYENKDLANKWQDAESRIERAIAQGIKLRDCYCQCKNCQKAHKKLLEGKDKPEGEK